MAHPAGLCDAPSSSHLSRHDPQAPQPSSGTRPQGDPRIRRRGIGAGPPCRVREVARAFGIKPGHRLWLKRLLHETETPSRADREGSRARLPEVLAVEIVATDEDGELIAEPVDWTEAVRNPASCCCPASAVPRRAWASVRSSSWSIFIRPVRSPRTGSQAARTGETRSGRRVSREFTRQPHLAHRQEIRRSRPHGAVRLGGRGEGW